MTASKVLSAGLVLGMCCAGTLVGESAASGYTKYSADCHVAEPGDHDKVHYLRWNMYLSHDDTFDYVNSVEYWLEGAGTGGKSNVKITFWVNGHKDWGPYENSFVKQDSSHNADSPYVKYPKRDGATYKVLRHDNLTGASYAGFDISGTDPYCTGGTGAV